MTLHAGWSVSLSSDGSTLAVGSPFDSEETGATWIFILNESLGSYSQLGEKIVGNGSVSPARQGKWIFLKLFHGMERVKTHSCDNFFSSSGWSVSLSSNGSILAVGGPLDGPSYAPRIGSTWLFQFNGSTYNQLGDKLVGTKYLGYSSQGKQTWMAKKVSC